ncbi:Septum site-determining protein MinC [Marinobacterium lacunae]|uniref:Probable septum site-determining protein MinC n=1 Tax=Marinobacterium lacunae TaxID=1232683 RepID=A0A081FVQ6_9GAMM|nr:septum site-determining protein MinC [Marinobacterium lacunae]KEA62611.1 Septum site-determining protein MinC [Marinobacterium lacunae]MBR9882884.1 septum site-determining protein MinC [Oceanospirillales bacterium]
MTSENRSTDTPLFRFKNSRVSLNELILLDFDAERLRIELEQHSARLPSLFQQMPVLLNLDQIPAERPLPPLQELLEICRGSQLNPIGVKGNERYDAELCRSLGLADFGQTTRGELARSAAQDTAVSEPTPVADKTVEPAAAEGNRTRILTTPVRSGQQVYVQGGDLIVLSSVGAGAEVMADGNIHVYGPLRGRAMAGVNGNTDARIFCQSLEAELISIAGYFKASEDLQSDHWQKPAQAWLSGTRLDTAAL